MIGAMVTGSYEAAANEVHLQEKMSQYIKEPGRSPAR